MPKRGRAVLWPSVYNSEPMISDRRFMHQALPVIAGLKFGANAWVHMCVKHRDDCVLLFFIALYSNIPSNKMLFHLPTPGSTIRLPN